MNIWAAGPIMVLLSQGHAALDFCQGKVKKMGYTNVWRYYTGIHNDQKPAKEWWEGEAI